MSVGGVYKLISNNGIQDKLIMATDQLMERINSISMEKIKGLKIKYPNKTDKELLSMEENWTPTLNTIEKTHSVFINSSFKPFVAMAHEYSRTPPNKGVARFGNTFSFTLPIIGEFVNDVVMYIKLSGLKQGNPDVRVRYVEFLGHKLMKKVVFKVQNHKFDEYGADEMNAYWQYKVPQHKEQGYLRNIGQEIPKLGYLTADPVNDEVREYRWFGDGPQTFKKEHVEVEMWIPILFWFKDIKTALPNFILPMSQTDIDVTLEEAENLISYNNIAGPGGPLEYVLPTISDCCLYVNHLFLLPEINRIFISRFGFQLIRVHRKMGKIITKSSDKVLLDQLKWPVETIYVGFVPLLNGKASYWHKNTFMKEVNVEQAVIVGGALAINNATYLSESHVVSKIGLSAYDIDIYPSLPPSFYNSYLPYRYGEHIKTPKDNGWYMMNFNFNPGEYNPSGHFNISQSRELYLSYESAIEPGTSDPIIRANNPVGLMVLSDCINFLLFKDGNVSLRFST